MKKILKWTSIVLGGLLGLMLLAGVVLYPMGKKTLSKTYPNVAVEQVTIPTDADAVARGKRLSTIWACGRCHGDNLGGSLIQNDPIDGYVPLFGTIPASNLTSGKGGIGTSYTDMDWIRAIRYGVKPNGSGEVFMYDYSTMSDGDLADLIAYLKQIPPVDSDQPAVSYGPILPVAVGIGWFAPAAGTIDNTAPRSPKPVVGATREYGKYLSALCTSCHGGIVGRVSGTYRQEEFVQTLRTGVLPNGRDLRRVMPPRIYGQLNDTELTALWLYFQTQSSKQAQP